MLLRNQLRMHCDREVRSLAPSTSSHVITHEWPKPEPRRRLEHYSAMLDLPHLGGAASQDRLQPAPAKRTLGHRANPHCSVCSVRVPVCMWRAWRAWRAKKRQKCKAAPHPMKPQASPVPRPRRAPELSTALCSCQALLEAVIFMASRGMHCTLI